MMRLAGGQGRRIQGAGRWAVVARLRATVGAVDERVEAGLSVRMGVGETRQRRKAYSEDLGLTFGDREPCSDSYVTAVAKNWAALAMQLTHMPVAAQGSCAIHRHP